MLSSRVQLALSHSISFSPSAVFSSAPLHCVFPTSPFPPFVCSRILSSLPYLPPIYSVSRSFSPLSYPPPSSSASAGTVCPRFRTRQREIDVYLPVSTNSARSCVARQEIQAIDRIPHQNHSTASRSFLLHSCR